MWLVKALVRVSSFLVRSLPRRMQLWIGTFLGFLWFSVFRIRRSVVLQNLKIAFPDQTEAWRRRVGFKSLENMGQTLIEYLILVGYKPSDVDRYFDFEGLEKFEAEEKAGRGVLVLTAHMGNGDFGCVGLASKGFPMTVISKQFRAKWLNEAWFGLRKRLGSRFISDEKSSFEILRSLKGKHRVIFVLDQFMGPPSGVETTFFGRKTGTAQGLALFHQRTGLSVVPGLILRQPNGRLLVRAEDPIPFEDQGTPEKTISFMTQKYTDKIEEWVRANPEQWMWLHKRWKKFEVR